MNQNKKTGFFNKMYGFCGCAYQNKLKIKSSFLFRMLVIFQEAKQNGTIFFLEPKRNKYFSETERNEKKTFFNPWYQHSKNYFKLIIKHINLRSTGTSSVLCGVVASLHDYLRTFTSQLILLFIEQPVYNIFE
jgi:hypothetical protein